MSIETLTAAILSKMSEVGKWQSDFLQHLFRLALSMRYRFNFLNMERQGRYNESTYRHNFQRDFDWLGFNQQMILDNTLSERIIVFDPSHISKSGKFTPGVGWHWSGSAGAPKWGLEIGGFSVVDIVNHTALHLYAEQTLPKIVEKSSSLLTYYGDLIREKADELYKISPWLVCDAYFSRKPFVDQVLQTNLHLITRLRDDAALRYPYLGPDKAGRGRNKVFAGKVNVRQLDEQYFTPCAIGDDGEQAFEAILYINAWKRWAKVVVVHYYKEASQIKSAKIYVSTLTTMSGADLWVYYKARFQSEFLFRDAKQHTGLADSQSRNEQTLNFHFNAALSAVSCAKVLHWMNLPTEKRGPFSMADIKTQYVNELMLEHFFLAYGMNPNQEKNKPIYQILCNYGKIAA
jgi:DDE superfamily endonuclease